MKNEFVTYEQALTLKELGFDEKCLTYYYNEILVFTPIPSLNTNSFWVGKDNNFITVPLKQQVFRWLSIKLDMPDLMIPIEDLAQNTLIDKLILELKSKHLLL